MAQTTGVGWSVVIFTSRETPEQVLKGIDACQLACGNRPSIIDVVVNGNPTLAKVLSEKIDTQRDQNSPITKRVWSIVQGDKAHAWNCYAHQIWPRSEVTFFLDGYVEVQADSFVRLAEGLAKHPQAKASTGVDTVGRASEQLAKFQEEISGLHGNLHALRQEAMNQIQQSGFRLPLGLYRVDAILESCLKYNFDPASNPWEPKRVLVVKEVTWKRPVLSRWKLKDLLTQWRRMIRQGQGDVEQQALKTFWTEEKKQPNQLPKTVQELLTDWITRFPDRWKGLAKNPLRKRAIRKALKPHNWKQAEVPPQLISNR